MEEYNVNKFQEDVEKIDNTDFIKAIEAMRADYTDENKSEVLNRAVFDVSFFVPAFVDTESSELVKGNDNRLSFSQRPKTRFVLVENPQGEKYIPAFTDHNDLIKFRNQQAEGCQAFVMTFPDLASVVETFPNIAGFVVNPFEHNLPFAKDFILAIKKNIMDQLEQIEKDKQNYKSQY